MRRLDYTSDYARLYDDLFDKGERDFSIKEIVPTGKKITYYQGSGTIVRKYKVTLRFTSDGNHPHVDKYLKVTWNKSINCNFETFKHDMDGTDVPSIWDQVRHNVQHDCKLLEGETHD